MPFQLEEKTQQVLETLKRQAEARKMSLAEYLQLLAEAGDMTAAQDCLCSKDFECLLDQVSEGLDTLPALPSGFSRQDIYSGHD